MENTEYEDAWGEEEGAPAPATNALKKAAMEKRDAEAREFSEAFFADEPKSEA